MNLSGIGFMYFLPAALLLYWMVPRRPAWQNAVLLLAGQAFFATWNVSLLPVLWIATAVDYSAGYFLSGTGRRPSARRVALWASVAFNVALLGFFKYAGFFADSLNQFLAAVGMPVSLPVLRLVLPLGISYWTLQKLAYVIDVYYERIPACRNPLTFATFVGFFPQLIAGPITRGRAMLPQFSEGRKPKPGLVASGAGWFLFGLALKSWAADFLAMNIVDQVFADHASFDRAAHWGALFGYTLQLFCDFGGYSFMAVGVGRLFGIDLPHNFNRPFLSRSMMEFWRRWHITLNTWLFDYLFASLTTGRGWFRGRMAASFLVVFLLSGLWHGAMWTFVTWGLLQGIALAVSHGWDEFYRGLCRKDRKWVAIRRGRPYLLSAWAITQLFFVFSLIPFRSSSLADAWGFLGGLFAGGGDGHVTVLSINMWLAAAVVLAYHLLEYEAVARWWRRFQSLPAPVRGIAYGLVVVFLLIYAPVGGGTFIYAQF